MTAHRPEKQAAASTKNTTKTFKHNTRFPCLLEMINVMQYASTNYVKCTVNGICSLPSINPQRQQSQHSRRSIAFLYYNLWLFVLCAL